MPATLKRKTKSKAVAPPQEIERAETLLEAEYERASTVAIGALRLLSQIEVRCKDLEPSELRLTPSEKTLLRSGGIEYSSEHELCRILRKVRGTRAMLEEFSFERLAECQADYEKAQRAVLETLGTLDDLEIDGDGAEPAISRQLNNLQRKLSDLRTAEQNAAHRLQRQQELLERLEASAPSHLRDLVKIRQQICESDDRFRQLHETSDQIRNIEHLLFCTKQGGVLDPSKNSARKALVSYARENGLGTWTPARGFAEVDADNLRDHLRELESETLPALKADQIRLTEETQQLIAEANPKRPIHDWIDSRGTITLDSLAAAL